ncbi:MAG: NAD(P)H-dependent oxidoreductase [Bacteroidota bacterium]|nr:NAD(P)H-dependent oxidoreductase [Bacteroidota bacterium]
MNSRKKVFAIIGSAGSDSANEALVKHIATETKGVLELSIFNALKTLPHFDPELSVHQTPDIIVNVRREIEAADGVLICTPEYVFSIPSGLKNVIEWCVATTVFSNKPVGIITASANGAKGHEELQLILQTIEAKCTADTSLLIPGVKGKIDAMGKIKDAYTLQQLQHFIQSFQQLLEISGATH